MPASGRAAQTRPAQQSRASSGTLGPGGVDADGEVDTFDGDFSKWVAVDVVLDQVPAGATEQRATWLALGLDACGDVHLQTDGCVGGPSIRSEGADAEHAGVDPDPHFQRLFDAEVEPRLVEFAEPRMHRARSGQSVAN